MCAHAYASCVEFQEHPRLILLVWWGGLSKRPASQGFTRVYGMYMCVDRGTITVYPNHVLASYLYAYVLVERPG